MREFVYNSWNHIMNAEGNPLRNIPDLHVRHMIMQVLAFMWSTVFSIAIAESVYAFGISAIVHVLFIAAVVITVATFKIAERNPQAFNLRPGYHSVGRTRHTMWINGKKVVLPAGDPGGEHE